MRVFVTVLLLLAISFSVLSQEISARFELVKMDKTVNTFRHEAAPIVSPDGNTLYFFVQDHPENTLGKDDTQDIWMSRKGEDGTWSSAEHLRSPFNIHRSNQVFTVFEDGSLFIKGGRSKGEKGFSIVQGSSLQELDVKDFKSMNKGRFYGASMSADKKHMIIYFSEKDNAIESDLYASHQQPDGSWSRPEKLKLSASQDDVGTFLGPDQRTLYYASARQAPGRQGGLDIYRTTRLDDTWMNWSTPVNMGKPVNTSALDFYFTMDKDGNIFTSRANKALEGAQLDLYMLVPKNFNVILEGLVLNEKTKEPVKTTVLMDIPDRERDTLQADASGKFRITLPEISEIRLATAAENFLPKNAKITVPLLYSDTTISVELLLKPIAKKLVLAGNVYDKKTEQPLSAARVELALRTDPKVNYRLAVNGQGFEREVPKLGWYMMTASAEGYMNTTDSIHFNAEGLSPLSKDLYLQPIEVGVTVRLKNIYFDFDRTTLQSQSFAELNKVVDFLKQNPTVEIEIAGHTDNKGSDDYNQNLSQGRSQAVVDYLISQGIEDFRLMAHGYGESKPIDTNDTEDGRANNRRVEFTVLKK